MSNIEEEVFCLKYELNCVTGILIKGDLERWLPSFSYEGTEKEHLMRYEWACQFAQNKRVLDIACGTGYGSYLLVTKGKAKYVVGCDIDEDAVRYSKYRNQASNLAYQKEDAEKFKFNEKFDLIISFETVEHLRNSNNYLDSIKQNLNEGGIFIVSTPISQMTVNNKPGNKFHLIEWGFNEFQSILSKSFDVKEVYLQLYPKFSPIKYIFYKIFSFLPFIKLKQKEESLSIKKYIPSNKKTDFGGRGYQLVVCVNK